jgi:hypothetical protein
MGRKKLSRCGVVGNQGAAPDFRLPGFKQSWAKREEWRGSKRKGLAILKGDQTIQFKFKFEFKQTKQCTTMNAKTNYYDTFI